MKKTVAPIRLAGSPLGKTRHVCAFFNSDDDEYRVLLPFIRTGSSVATRRFTSLIRINVMTICNA